MHVCIREHEAVLAQLEAMRKERDHWKANHDNRVAAARVLIERPDTPFERTHAYRAYVALQEQVDALRRGLAEANQREAYESGLASSRALESAELKARLLIFEKHLRGRRSNDPDASYSLAARVEALESCLENIRLFAARQRGEEWARTILRFCPPGSPLRKEQENGA